MKLRRETSQTIWRTVVFAGAMLGAPACHHDTAATTTPTPPPPATTNSDTTMGASSTTTKSTPDTAQMPMTPTAKPAPQQIADPNANPCGGTANANPCGGGDQTKATPAANPCGDVADPPPPRPRGGGNHVPQGRGFVLS
jgi:hypothetical protein